MAHVIIATWKARLGNEAEIAGILKDLSVASRLEPGCRFYQAQESLETPGVFVVYEIYDDSAAADAHTQSDHFRTCVSERAAFLLESRERRIFETVGSPQTAHG
jgi:quinol monooxygenase YgiN